MLTSNPQEGDIAAQSVSAGQAPLLSTTTAMGTYRWVILFAIWISFGISIIDRMAWGNISLLYAQSLGLPVAALGSFFSAFYVGYLITNATFGFAADYFGGRRIIAVMLLALGVLTFAFGCTRSITAGLIIQALMGLVAGMDYSACVKLLSDSFSSKKKATAMGLFLTAGPVGLTLPNLFIPSLAKTYGWQGVYQALGSVTILIGIGAYLMLRDVNDSLSFGERTTKARRPFRYLLRNKRFLIAAFAGFGALWGAWGFAFWSNALLVQGHHITPVRAGFIISIFGGMGIVAKPFSGWFADHVRIPKATLAIFWTLAFAVSLSIFGYLSTPFAFTVFSGIVGFTAWAGTVLIATLVLECVGPELSGASSGLANSLWMIGSVLVPLVVGATFEYLHSFHAAILTLAAGPLFAAIVLCLMPKQPKQVF
ncbi:MFS transporter [Burkholderia pseudomallei]|nr:MFS transporter [Burkholderia pseudomallei]